MVLSGISAFREICAKSPIWYQALSKLEPHLSRDNGKKAKAWLDMPFLKLPNGQKAAIIAECDSTFDAFTQIKYLHAGLTWKDWDWIVACRQTNGRGQYGREWQSPLGNLCVSMRLPRLPNGLSGGKDYTVLLPLLFGAEIVRQLKANGYSVALKWPNDIITNIPSKENIFGKAGGLLLERKKNSLILGLGLNFAPADEWQSMMIEDNPVLPPVSLSWPPPQKYADMNEPTLLDFWQSLSVLLKKAWLRWLEMDNVSLLQEIENVLAFRGEKVEFSDSANTMRTVGYLCGLGACGELIIKSADGLQSHFCGSLRYCRF